VAKKEEQQTLPEFPVVAKKEEQQTLPEFPVVARLEPADFDNEKNINFTRIHHLDEWGKKVKLFQPSFEINQTIVPSMEKKYCIVSGYEIIYPRPDSKYLKTRDVKFYHENDHSVYANLFKRIARSKYRNASLEEQYREIAHNIRNNERNPPNNTKRDILKVLQRPSLFDTLPYIDPEKRRIAGI